MQQQTWGNGHLPFLAVGRVKDSITLAYYIESVDTEQQDQTQEVFQKLLKASSQKLAAGQRTRLQWNNGSVCFLMDEQGRLLYCVVTSSLSYPERQAYQLLYDFRGLVERDDTIDLDDSAEHSLNDKLKDQMRELVKKYESMQDSKMSSANITPPDTSLAPPYQDGREQSGNYKKWILLVIVVAIIVLVIIWANQGSKGDDEKKALIMYI
ncbi:unnamed protein product [Cladocopium goreaui]|uniref:Longin domain-containing protein n=1 Tax=Cladocopium goreaui TaxID=2562237 RepID=A0A9P1FXV2_9DINO|nr:unnamed protein product [Cladocopium goreaui]|mmetsp:Transcript_16714/g.36870  ORF Transcript_16714/g.36870 Transcript_16714/m.36870 type:complete len:210 (+) Transcript_16714:53-682(+)